MSKNNPQINRLKFTQRQNSCFYHEYYHESPRNTINSLPNNLLSSILCFHVEIPPISTITFPLIESFHPRSSQIFIHEAHSSAQHLVLVVFLTKVQSLFAEVTVHTLKFLLDCSTPQTLCSPCFVYLFTLGYIISKSNKYSFFFNAPVSQWYGFFCLYYRLPLVRDF